MSRQRLTEASLSRHGIALILAALAASQGWWDRHFLPVFNVERSTIVAAEQAGRGLIALAGATFALILRRPIAAILSRATLGGALRILLAAVLALGAGEVILRAPPPLTPPARARPIRGSGSRDARPTRGSVGVSCRRDRSWRWRRAAVCPTALTPPG